MQIISWILGEYGSLSPKKSKIRKMIDLLSESMYRTFEDETTRCWILGGITKLHASQRFDENPRVDAVICDFLESKNVEIQQKCIEYKYFSELSQGLPNSGADLSLNTPMKPSEVKAQCFDWDLSFLDKYVQQQRDEGKKDYDVRKRKMVEAPLAIEAGLNLKPYGPP